MRDGDRGMYRVINPNSILSVVRSVSGLPAYMRDGTIVILITGGARLPRLDRINEEFKRRFGRELIDVVDSIKIEKIKAL